MRLAGALLALAVLAGHAAPAEALSYGPPDCQALDRAVRESANFALVRIDWTGETRRQGEAHITPVRVVVQEVVKGRDIRRDQTLAWDDRVDDAGLELFGMDAPFYGKGAEHLAVIGGDGMVQLWGPVSFYEHNLRVCYRRALISRAG